MIRGGGFYGDIPGDHRRTGKATFWPNRDIFHNVLRFLSEDALIIKTTFVNGLFVLRMRASHFRAALQSAPVIGCMLPIIPHTWLVKNYKAEDWK